MAWGIKKVEEQRRLFIIACMQKKFKFSDICIQFGISRPTGYKWLERFKMESWEGLNNRSKKPINSPNATSAFQEDAILKVKYEYSKWGPKKILPELCKIHPDVEWPSLTTIENILKKNGLVVKRRLRKRLAKKTDPLGECNFSNDVWCMDFKGWWLTKDQQKCDPFTIMDGFSRYLLCCQKINFNDTNYVWAVFERLFREYGLPWRIRSDNGPPFATLGAGRLSRLAINLIKAGVTPEWIDPGKPQQNGRHERMHLTLKQEGVNSDLNLNQQIQKLNDFVKYYNFIRPHEALNQKCPGEVYKLSERYWDGRLRSPEYSSEYKVAKVGNCGKMSYKGDIVYVGRAFEGEPIGLILDEEKVKAYYGPIFLGIVKGNALEVERRLVRNKLNF